MKYNNHAWRGPQLSAEAVKGVSMLAIGFPASCSMIAQ